LRERVTSAVRDAPLLGVEPPGAGSRRWSVAGRAAWFGLGAAAALFVAFLLRPELPMEPGDAQAVSSGESGDPNGPRPDVPPDVPPDAVLGQSRLAAKAVLLEEMERVFPDQLSWVAETDGKVCVGLAERPGPRRRSEPALAVRVVVVSRRGPEDRWVPVWTVDMVTRGEEVVALTPECSGRGKVMVWAYPLPDGMIAVDASIALDDPVPLHSSFSGVCRGGVPEDVLSLRADEVEYRVYQVVSVLDNEVG
jgi:hypothetical protein